MQQRFDSQQLIKLSKSPAGQKLMQTLKESGGSDVERAASLASAGNMTEAKQALSALLANPEIQSLLKQLEGQI